MLPSKVSSSAASGHGVKVGLTVFDWICSRRTIALLHSVELLSLHNPVQLSPGNWS